jgi:anti-anti-sigma factor
MTVLESQHSADVLVCVPADLDISTLGRFREALEKAVSANPVRLVVDFSACRYLDAQAIRVLLDAHQQLWRLDSRLVLRACNPDTRRLLALAGVLNVFQLEPPTTTMSREVPS